MTPTGKTDFPQGLVRIVGHHDIDVDVFAVVIHLISELQQKREREREREKKPLCPKYIPNVEVQVT